MDFNDEGSDETISRGEDLQLENGSNSLELEHDSFAAAGDDGLGLEHNGGDVDLQDSLVPRSVEQRDAYTGILDEQVQLERQPVLWSPKGGRIDQQVTDAALRLGRHDTFEMPWTKMRFKPYDNLMTPAKLFRLPVLGRFDRPVPLSDKSAGTISSGWVGDMPFAGRRLLAARMAKTDDCLKMNALKRLRNIVLFHPEDSQLGRSMLNKAGSLVGEDELQKSLSDCVSGKAVGTLVKRVTDFNRFALWQVETNCSRPLNPSESDFYGYLQFLQRSGAAATAGASFLKSWNFMRFTIGAQPDSGVTLISGRIRGISSDMYARKRKLQQAPPLPVDFVYNMERYMHESDDDRMKTIVGFFLFCVYSCARFADAAKASPKALEFQQGERLTLVEVMVSDYKTATGERKAVLLPLIAIGTGLRNYSWAQAWKVARRRCGADQSEWLMPADSQTHSAWLQRRMTTAEGSYWLKDVLVMLGMEPLEAVKFSSHSMKSTCLSWAAKAGSMTVQERLWLGHHQSNESKMAITNARDVLAQVLTKLKRILDSIKAGLFDPDLSRVERVEQATGMTVVEPNFPERSPEELAVMHQLEVEREHEELHPYESDVESQAALEDDPIDLPCADPIESRPEFPDIDLATCLRHRISGIVHVRVADSILACGRSITLNLSEIDESLVQKQQLELCEQCRRGIGT